jgi:hypothetical protein
MVEVEAEAGGGVCLAELAEQAVVSASSSDGLAGTRCQQEEARTGVVSKSSSFAEVESESSPQSSLGEPVSNLFQLAKEGPWSGASKHPVCIVEDARSSPEIDQGKKFGSPSAPESRRTERVLQRPAVLARQIIGGIATEWLGHPLEEFAGKRRQAEFDSVFREPERVKTPRGEFNHLHVGLGTCQTDAFHPCLCDLALASGPTMAAANHLTFVSKPEWGRALLKPRGDEPRDLRRDVGTHERDLAGVSIHEAQHVPAIEGVESALEDVGLLERRRRDEFVAVRGKSLRQ